MSVMKYKDPTTGEVKKVGAPKADKSVAFTVTLTAASWTNNNQTISDPRFVSTGYAYTVAPASSSFVDYADSMVYADDVTTNGQMVFHCDSTPTADLTVNIVRMVTAERTKCLTWSAVAVELPQACS